MKKLYLIFIFLIFSVIVSAQSFRFTNAYSQTDTVTADTVIISPPSSNNIIWEIDIVNLSTDSTEIEISFSSVFADARRLVYGQSFYFKTLSTSMLPYLYVKRKSISGNGVFDYTTLGY